MTVTDAKEEEPLDPKVEAIRQKMMRLLMISGGIMMLGLMAVIAAIVYKVNTSVSRATVHAQSTLTIPANTKIISTALSDGRIMLTLESPASDRELRIFDRNGNLLNTIKIQQE